MLLASEKFDLYNKLDNDMFNHVVFVSNRSLMLLKKQGVGKDTWIRIGKYLWRLFRVLQAYNHKKRDITFNEIVNIVQDFAEVFGGK